MTMPIEEKNAMIFKEILGRSSPEQLSTIVVFLLNVRHHPNTGESMKRTIVDVIDAVGKNGL